MVLSSKYNVVVVGEGLSGTVIDLEGGVVSKMYLPTSFHDASIHRNRESHFLRHLDLPTLKTPKYIAEVQASNGNEPSIPTLTMHEIKGDFRSHDDVLAAGSVDSYASLGQQVGHVLAELHAAKPPRFRFDKQKSVLEMMVDQAEDFDMKASDRREFYSDICRKVRDMEATVMPVFCHGDMNFGNVVFEEGTDKITGVIDYAFSGYGMPETDFLHLNVEGLLPEVIDTYEAQTGRAFSEDRLKTVMLVNNMRGLVAIENMLSGDLEKEAREYLEEDQRMCITDMNTIAQELGMRVSPSIGFVPGAFDRK